MNSPPGSGEGRGLKRSVAQRCERVAMHEQFTLSHQGRWHRQIAMKRTRLGASSVDSISAPAGAQHVSPRREPWETASQCADKPQRGGTWRHALSAIPTPEPVSPLAGLCCYSRRFTHGSRRGLACDAPMGLDDECHDQHMTLPQVAPDDPTLVSTDPLPAPSGDEASERRTADNQRTNGAKPPHHKPQASPPRQASRPREFRTLNPGAPPCAAGSKFSQFCRLRGPRRGAARALSRVDSPMRNPKIPRENDAAICRRSSTIDFRPRPMQLRRKGPMW